MPLRRMHPQLWLTVGVCALWSIANGVTMLIEPPRMPPVMPPIPVGLGFMLAGILMIHGAFGPFVMAKVGAIITATQCAGMAAGLFIGYGHTPDSVTSSLDRPYNWLALGVWCLIWLKEPPVNPATAR